MRYWKHNLRYFNGKLQEIISVTYRDDGDDDGSVEEEWIDVPSVISECDDCYREEK